MNSEATDRRADAQPLGRRARNRAARHDQLLAAASDIVGEHGLEGLTMQAVADRVDCAVGTIYTYFASKSALMAALQTAAIQTLLATYHRSAAVWDDALAEADVDDAVSALVRVMAFGQLFVAGPELHPREFEFLQLLINTPEQTVNADDVRAVTPHALTLLTELLVVIEAAVSEGALSSTSQRAGDDGLRRTLRLIGALDGALLVSNANVTALPDPEAFQARHLTQLVTEDLLLAWGAPPRTLEAATVQLERMRAAGTLLPRVGD
jgi:AcrR family transcriptional regulator